MSPEALILLEPILIAAAVFGFGFWQLRELARLRERRRQHSRAEAEGAKPAARRTEERS